MTKMVERIKEVINPRLDQGENILSIGYFKQGLPHLLALITFSGAYALKTYYLGVTSKRLFIVPIDNITQKVDNNISDVQLSNVEMKGKNLFVRLSKDKKPQKFVRTGIPELIGIDIHEFEKVIADSKK